MLYFQTKARKLAFYFDIDIHEQVEKAQEPENGKED